MSEKIMIINYKQLLKELEASKQECHLLLGNGFNNSLGVNTSYRGIFEGMKREYADYKVLEEYMEECDYDIEKLIQKLKESITTTDLYYKVFLPNFIESKVKFDFMKAAYDIVKGEIKSIYNEEKNKEIYLLFKNFTNYFSLNYDPFLYLLLMKFKKADSNDAIGLQNTSQFKQQDLNAANCNIYTEIQKARNNGELVVTISGSASTTQELKNTTKSSFMSVIKIHFKDKGWATKDIERVCNQIWEEESGDEKLDNINDSFLFDEYKPENAKVQNIFFLHGAFHIYQDKKVIRKITQKQDKALYQRLEEIINSEEKDIICVLTGSSEEKNEEINSNEYLRNNFNKLSSISGSLVIFGSSLAKNDSHIFNQINNSSINKIYISSKPENVESDSIGEAEGSPKFTNPESFDYHYPK